MQTQSYRNTFNAYTGQNDAPTPELIAAVNCANGERHIYMLHGLPEGIDPGAWAVLASHLMENGGGSTLTHHVFEPRKLVTDRLHLFTIGQNTVGCGDWVAFL